MPQLQFGTSSYERGEGDLPELPVVNLYAEEAPTEAKGVALQSRPALSPSGVVMGNGPTQAFLKRDGVLGGDLIGVSGGNLYHEDDLIGPIAGSGHVSMAGNELGVMVCAGSLLYFYDGANLTAVSFPDDAGVSHVFVGASRFWFIRADTGKIYWTDALEIDVEALDFATAESLPDKLLQGLWIDDAAILFGTESVEFWPNTPSNELPIQPLEGRVIERGLKAIGCASPLGSTFAFVTNRNEVCVGDENNIISNVGLQARIKKSASVSLFRLFIDGLEFLALRLDGETQVWNRRTGMWSEFASFGETNWAACCSDGAIMGSAINGIVYEWGDGKDAEGVLERRWRAGFPLDGGSVDINVLRVRCNPGQTSYLTGDYADPLIESRTSRDQGRTWSKWRGASLGQMGRYRERIEWRALGSASQPAFLAEFRVTDPVPIRCSGVTVNENWGGR